MNKRHLKWTVISLVALALVALTSWYQRNHYLYHFTGSTMGTEYSIKLRGLYPWQKGKLSIDINKALNEINMSMSHYIKESEVSRFNKQNTTNWQQVSSQLIEVLSAAKRIHQQTDGAFDITVAPLINLWGFGEKSRSDFWNLTPPSKDDINQLLSETGSEKLVIDAKQSKIKKTHESLTINLSAIAKGYGVDVIAKVLDEKNIQHYLVEIGGELRTKGYKESDTPWRIAIESPLLDKREAQRILQITNAGVATSGDYRNYFEHEGVRYSHTLDPETGYPISHNLASVTVIADTTMEADALATALMVMGSNKAKQLIEKNQLKVVLITKDSGAPNKFVEYYSPALKAHKTIKIL